MSRQREKRKLMREYSFRDMFPDARPENLPALSEMFFELEAQGARRSVLELLIERLKLELQKTEDQEARELIDRWKEGTMIDTVLEFAEL
jgi:hypothetical protein